MKYTLDMLNIFILTFLLIFFCAEHSQEEKLTSFSWGVNNTTPTVFLLRVVKNIFLTYYHLVASVEQLN